VWWPGVVVLVLVVYSLAASAAMMTQRNSSELEHNASDSKC